MAFFEWKENFNIGVAEIDWQHREFLDYLNQCYELLTLKKDAPVSKEIIDKLKMYVEKHFEYEENLFRVIGYSETETQIKQHNYFVLRVLDLDDELISGNIERLNSVMCFLRDWFINHILQADREYVPFVDAFNKR